MATVTGLIQDAAGNTATSGSVQFKLSPWSPAILYRVGGISLIAPTLATCGIDATGHIKNLTLSGACQVWGNDNITPANTCYQVVEAPGGTIDRTIDGVQITGAGGDLASPTFCPSVRITPEIAAVTTAPSNANVIPGTDNFYNVGGPQNRYAHGYFTNLDVTGGSCLGCGTAPGQKIVDGVTYATIQAAITAAGSANSVLIPATYAGTDTYTNPNKIQIVDLRGLPNRQRGYINVLTDCGLKGDGVTDDAAAMVTCFASYGGGSHFFFPQTSLTNGCSFFFGSSIVPTTIGTVIEGAGGTFLNNVNALGGTVLCFAAGVTGINLSSGAAGCGGCTVKNIALLGAEQTQHLQNPSLLNIPSATNLPLTQRSLASVQRTSNVITGSVTRLGGIEGLTQQVGSTIKLSGIVGDATLNGLCDVLTLTGYTAFGGNPNGFTCTLNGADTALFTTDGILTPPTTGASAADGIRVCNNFNNIFNVVIQGFGRHGINADSFAGHGCASPYSDNLTVRESFLNDNQGNGYLCYGVDCNANVLIANTMYYNVFWGIEDQSSLGNTHVGNQISNNSHFWASTTTPATKNLSTVTRTSSTVAVVMSQAIPFVKLGTCIVLAGVTDASFNTTSGQCFFVTSYTDTTHFSYIQPGAPSNASSSGGTVRIAKFSEAYLSSGLDDGAMKIGTQSAVAQPVILSNYVEGGQICKFSTNTILIGGANVPGCAQNIGDWVGQNISTQGCTGLGGILCLTNPSFVNLRDATGEAYLRAGATAVQSYGLTWLNFSSLRAWGLLGSPTGTLGGTGKFELTSQGYAQTRFVFFGKDITGNSYINGEGTGGVYFNRNSIGTNAGTGGAHFYSGGSGSAEVASVDAAGLGTFNGGVKAGSSGSTIADSRELIQNAHSCGTTTTCANTANGSLRIVTGTVALVSASPSTATVASISPAFTSTATYNCTATPEGATAAIAASGIAVSKVSGSSFTLTGPNTVTTVIDYTCIGN